MFWDADIFVLPALAAIRPAAARAMLEYRIRRLPAARARPRPLGCAAPGSRGSPPLTAATSPRGSSAGARRADPDPHRAHEEHVVADVAWAACHYVDWTGDDEFLHGAGGQT